KLLAAVDTMLTRSANADARGAQFTPKPDAWGRAVQERLSALPGETRTQLDALLALAAEGGENAKPSKGWLKHPNEALALADRAHTGASLLELLERNEPGSALDLQNQNTLRALIWLIALACPPGAARRLEAYAQKCLTFSSAHFAYLSLVLGNATVHAF